MAILKISHSPSRRRRMDSRHGRATNSALRRYDTWRTRHPIRPMVDNDAETPVETQRGQIVQTEAGSDHVG